MPDPIPSCFRGGAAAAAPPSAATATAAGPSVTTSIYETHLGLAALTWSRTVLGLSLRVDLRLPSPSGGAASASDAASVSSSGAASADGCADASFRFRLRPWLFWKRRGSRRFQIKESQSSHGGIGHHCHHRVVDFAWDLTRARFPPGSGPEPCAGFFVAVAVDGEMFLAVGDMEREAYKRTKARNPFPAANPSSKKGEPGNPILISRREHVVLSGAGRPYTTRAKLGGKEREISIDLGGGGASEAKMVVGLDGKRVIQVKRLRWKFRGNEKVEIDGGARVQVSWDVHNWLFDREPDPSSAPAPAAPHAATDLGHAVFVFREDDADGNPSRRHHHHPGGKHRSGGGGGWWGVYGLGNFPSSDRSCSSIGGGGGGPSAVAKGIGKKNKSLLKTSSSSSSSSASSGSSSSVADWASAEESELQGSGGFSLLIYMWRS